MRTPRSSKFEQAAEVRNQIAALSRVLHQQAIGDRAATRTSTSSRSCVQGGARLRQPGDGARRPPPRRPRVLPDARRGRERHRRVDDDDAIDVATVLEVQVLEHFIAQHYIQARRCLPLLIRASRRADGRRCREQAACSIDLCSSPRGQRRLWLEMAQKGAEIALARLLAEEGSQQARTRALVEALDLAMRRPRTRSASSASTSATRRARRRRRRASCSSTTRCRTREYRRYNIDGITPGDDYAAMRQVLMRRYEEGAPDGERRDAGPGAGRRRQGPGRDGARGVRGAGPRHRPDRRRREGRGPQGRPGELVFADGRAPVELGKESAALMLVAQIRDEAHRFAITGMRARRAKTRADRAAGGNRRHRREAAAALLPRFGGVRGVQAASVEDLASVEGISRELAEEIYRHCTERGTLPLALVAPAVQAAQWHLRLHVAISLSRCRSTSRFS